MRRVGVFLGITLLCVGLSAWAQDTASIVGTVKDATGAVIPGATVNVSNPAKAFTRVLVTDAAGAFSISAMPIGEYEISADAKGFKKETRTGIALTVGQVQRVDFTLQIGAATQQVTVQGNLPHVQTETAAISDVVTGQQISQLELNGRNFVSLALMVPGAIPDNGLDTSHVGVYGNNNISFNGSRMQYNNWEIDGGNNTDEGSAGTFNVYPNLDSIAEFRISTSNYGADMGHHAGATIEVATKSGTKQFHGDVSEYLRNSATDSNDWFVNRQVNPPGGHAPKSPLKQNEYGYTLGGPFYIPGHYNTDKSKTFFFWSEDWRKIREGQVISSGVPSVLERQGDFSECDPKSPNYNKVVAAGCVLPSLNGITYDSVKSVPGANPQDYTNGTDILNGLVPMPNNGPNGWILSSSTATNWRQEQIRVDQNVSDKTQVFVRYTHDAWNTVAIPALWSWSNYDTVKTPFDGPGTTAVLHITHNFNPGLMNEFIMGWTQDHILLYNQTGASSPAHSINRPSSFQMAHFFPANDSNPLLPGIIIAGGGPQIAEDASNHPWFNSNPILTWKDNVAMIHGNHTLKFGFFLEKYRKNEQFGGDTQGYAQFTTWGNNSTGNGLADLFLGRFAQYSEGTETFNGVPVGGYPKGHWRYTDFEPYLQDNWRVTPRLTLNLGVRYYLMTHIRDVTRPTVDSGFLPALYNPNAEAQLDANGNLVQGTGHLYTTFGNGLVECGVGGIPPGCQGNTFGNIAPRFGFSWDPFGHGTTAIRGGYGIYYEAGNGNEAQSEGGEGNPPVALNPSAFNVTGYANIQPVFTNGTYSAPLGPTSYTAWPGLQKWGSEQQFSLGIEHQYGANNLLSVSYVGMLGRHLATGFGLNQVPDGLGMVKVPVLAGANQYCDASGNCDAQNALINQAEPAVFFQPYHAYSAITMKENTANSSYNALQVNFRHTFSHGLTFQTAYTWSHNIDNSSSTYFVPVDSTNFARWKSTSDLNRTHALVFNYIYDVPFFKNASNMFVRGALGGWTVSGITSFYSGQPVDFGCGINGFSTGIGGGVRCNTIGPLKIDKGTYNDPTFGPTPTWFNPGVITQPNMSQLYANGEPGMFGYMGRNVLTGPGRNNTDLGIFKSFKVSKLGEASNLQVRWEMFNAWNHPQWKGINAGCSGSDTFGQACNDPNNDIGNGEVNSDWGPRVMQFGLKLTF